jgi:hypothetical protein
MIVQLQKLRQNYPAWFVVALDLLRGDARALAKMMAQRLPSSIILFRLARGRAPKSGESLALTQQERDDAEQRFDKNVPIVRRVLERLTRFALLSYFHAGEVVQSRLKEAHVDLEFFDWSQPEIAGVALDDHDLLELLNTLHKEGILTKTEKLIYPPDEYVVLWRLNA